MLPDDEPPPFDIELDIEPFIFIELFDIELFDIEPFIFIELLMFIGRFIFIELLKLALPLSEGQAAPSSPSDKIADKVNILVIKNFSCLFQIQICI